MGASSGRRVAELFPVLLLVEAQEWSAGAAFIPASPIRRIARLRRTTLEPYQLRKKKP